MKSLTEKIEKSNNIMTSLQTEVKTVKEDTKTYKQSFGAVKPGKSVSVPEKFALGLCIRGIPEKMQNLPLLMSGYTLTLLKLKLFSNF